MSKLRPESQSSFGRAISDETALYLIRDSVARRKSLIFGRLHDGYGGHCAIGSFWADNPKITLHSALIDEVAAVNDSVPVSATPYERWKKVNSWLRWKIRIISNRSTNARK
jgi:hypothetical protein